ncbi:MAG: hypothetical protein ACI9JM_003412, partial [Halioglobus sp.]
FAFMAFTDGAIIDYLATLFLRPLIF